MKKTIYTLNIDDYSPEIRELTTPLLKNYAFKVGAELCEITERKFPSWPITYEKLQIHRLAKENQSDWNIYIDSDVLIHPDMFDVTAHLHKDTVCHNASDPATIRWKYDAYFLRDGRHIGSCNWFTIASDWCLDLWKPLDITLEESLSNIFPILNEILSKHCDKSHLIDDYALSSNIARFGLKFATVLDLLTKLKLNPRFLWHTYNTPLVRKLDEMKRIVDEWGIPRSTPKTFKDLPSHVQNWLKSRPESDSFPYPNYKEIEGWMSLRELNWLYEESKSRNNIVEVGSWFGRSTRALLTGCPEVVHAVDTFKGSPSELTTTHAFAVEGDVYGRFCQNVGHFSNLNTLKDDSLLASEFFQDLSLDLVFIDAEHTYESVLKDLIAWYPKVKLEGMLCGHDRLQGGVPQALEHFFGFTPEIGVDSIWKFVKSTASFPMAIFEEFSVDNKGEK